MRSILPDGETVPERQVRSYTTDADYFGVYCLQAHEVTSLCGADP